MQSILVVDDSASMRLMLGQVLRDAGHQVLEAKDGAEALEKVRGQSFDLVITDQNMPHMDGLTLTARLRSLPQYRSVPILVLTTESDPSVKSAGRQAGATGWLVKPFDPVRLVEVIGKLAANGAGGRA
jgi:two-component system, chemotaxis family, chemotaxis protein CheY